MKNFRFITVSLIIMLIFSLSVNAAFPEPAANFFVNDLAGVLTQEQGNAILALNDNLAGGGAQVVVLTVDFLGGMNIADYALEVFNRWGIGDSERNNGVLILLAIAEDNYYVATGSGVETVISSGQIQLILDTYMEPYFDAGDFGGGVVATATEIARRLLAHYGTTGAAPIDDAAAITPHTAEPVAAATSAAGLSATVFSLLTNVFVVFIIIVLLIVIFTPRRPMMGPMGGPMRPMRRRWFGGPWMWGGMWSPWSPFSPWNRRRGGWGRGNSPPPPNPGNMGGAGRNQAGRTPQGGGGRSAGSGAGRSGGGFGGLGGFGGGFSGGRGGSPGGGRSSGGGAGRRGR